MPKSGNSWTEGDEVMLTCSARGFPEPKLTWSQRGDTVRGFPCHPEPTPSSTGNPDPQRSKLHVPQHSTSAFTPQPLIPRGWA
jgi:hypothetical protein